MKTPLEQAAEAFDNWRINRPKRSPVPGELITQSLSLLEQYSKNEIVSALSINHKMLNRWAEEQPADNAFIVLPTAAAESLSPTYNKSLEISIKFTGGAHLTLSGTNAELTTFVSDLQQRGAL